MTIKPGTGIWDKVSAFWEVMKRGREVFNPVAWRLRQITVVHIATLISSGLLLSRSFGYELPLTQDDIHSLASVIMLGAGLFNHFATVATTPEINILGKKDRRTGDGDSGLLNTQSIQDTDKGTGIQDNTQRRREEDIATIKTELPNQSGTTSGGNGPTEQDKELEKQRLEGSQGG